MNSGRVRTIHRRLGISLVCFLLVQAIAGMLMSIGKLASMDASRLYNLLYSIHADWDPPGSIYRIILGLAAAAQGILGIMIFLARLRLKTGDKTISPIPLSPDRPCELKKEDAVSTLSFAADIRPLFREKDVAAMKQYGLDLSSYQAVKERSGDIYAALSAKKMPCDGSWKESRQQKLKEWMESGMQP